MLIFLELLHTATYVFRSEKQNSLVYGLHFSQVKSKCENKKLRDYLSGYVKNYTFYFILIMSRFILKFTFIIGFISSCAANSYDERTVYTQALLTVKYSTRPGHHPDGKLSGNGKYAKSSPKSAAKGPLYYAGHQETWCKPFKMKLGSGHRTAPSSWIALIPKENSSCSDSTKILVAKKLNASAVIIYNDKSDVVPVILDDVHSMKTVMVDLETGKRFIKIINNEEPVKFGVYCEILVGTHYVDRRWRVSRTSVLFVLVSFILLMCISLAWLVFYYVQRFRHIYRNDRKEVKFFFTCSYIYLQEKTKCNLYPL